MGKWKSHDKRLNHWWKEMVLHSWDTLPERFARVKTEKEYKIHPEFEIFLNFKKVGWSWEVVPNSGISEMTILKVAQIKNYDSLWKQWKEKLP